jgi:hypothetical protein
VTDPIGTIEDSGEHERPLSVEAVQRRAERAQRGINAPAMSAYQRQRAGSEIKRTPGECLDASTTAGWPRIASAAGDRPLHVEGGGH